MHKNVYSTHCFFFFFFFFFFVVVVVVFNQIFSSFPIVEMNADYVEICKVGNSEANFLTRFAGSFFTEIFKILL